MGELISNEKNLIVQEKVHKTGDIQFLDTSTDFRVMYLSGCEKIYYISDMHIDMHIKNKKRIKGNEIKKYIKSIVESLLETIDFSRRGSIIFLGDTSKSYKINELFYLMFMKGLLERDRYSHYTVYAVLGNHEYMDFKDKDMCILTYEKFFSSLNIKLLNNKSYFLSKCENTRTSIPIKSGILMIGSTGFSGRNKYYNAKIGLYSSCIDEKVELEETNKWYEYYKNALRMAKEHNCVLLVCTHNHLSDWMKNTYSEYPTIFLNGHTHQNNVYIDNKSDIYVYSDNQIGYKNENFIFKQVYVYAKKNPFKNYSDGYYEIRLENYIEYVQYTGTIILSLKRIENYLKNGVLYLIKKDNIYGFFILRNNGNVLICQGGKTKKIRDKGNIEEIYFNFSVIIKNSYKLFFKYRQWQESISQEVKKIGGTGRVHGFIIDIDYYNHIYVCPNGDIGFYYSPIIGVRKFYNTLYELLETYGKSEMLKLYKEEYNKLSIITKMGLLSEPKIDEEEINIQMKEKWDIHKEFYTGSSKYLQLQRLFDLNWLRFWDDRLLYDMLN